MAEDGKEGANGRRLQYDGYVGNRMKNSVYPRSKKHNPRVMTKILAREDPTAANRKEDIHETNNN